MKFGKKFKRVTAFVLAIMLMMTTVVVPNSGWGSRTAKAASQGYTVNINLYDYLNPGQTQPTEAQLKAPDEPLKSNNGGGFYVVAIAKGGHPGDVWTTYAVKYVDSIGSATSAQTTVTFDRGDFRIDVNNGAGEFDHNDYKHHDGYWNNWTQSYVNEYNEGHYDTQNTYSMDSVRLYRVKDGVNSWQVKTDNISLEDMLAQFDDDSAPVGYKFADGTKNNNNAVIRLYKH
ncbi:MAG: hypothetical protein IKR27_07050, partial [Lachnospiraceae bacterium]|nr:hypothetical protein [Lachnospiraceae bacterium]